METVVTTPRQSTHRATEAFALRFRITPKTCFRRFPESRILCQNIVLCREAGSCRAVLCRTSP